MLSTFRLMRAWNLNEEYDNTKLHNIYIKSQKGPNQNPMLQIVGKITDM